MEQRQFSMWYFLMAFLGVLLIQIARGGLHRAHGRALAGDRAGVSLGCDGHRRVSRNLGERMNDG